SSLTWSTAWTVARRIRLTTSGFFSRYDVATMRCVVTYLPSGHRSRSSTRPFAPPSWLRRVARGVVRWDAQDVATTGGVSRVALLLQPGPEGDVLRVADRRRRELLSPKV